MSRKRFTAEEIINKLREADVLQSQGKTIIGLPSHKYLNPILIIHSPGFIHSMVVKVRS